MSEVLGRLAGWQHDLLMADALRIEAGAQRREMMVRDCRVGDDHRLTAPHQRKDLEARAGDQAGADQDVIAAVAELDAQPFDSFRFFGHAPVSAPGGVSARGQVASTAMVRAAVRSGGPSPLSIVISASA